MKRGRMLARFWLRLVGFTALLVLLLGYVVYVLTPKYDYGICSMTNLYQQPRDTVDVLVLGSSVAYAGVNTNVLWTEQGIAAYDLCSAEQSYWISYYYLKEALKTQRPSLILLDAKASMYQLDTLKRGRTILSTYGIRSPVTRWKAITACVKPEEVWEYMLAFPKIHTYYQSVTLDSFPFPPDNGGRGSDWKGYIEVDEHERHQRPSLVWTQTKRTIHPQQLAYFEKILDLAGAEGIPVLVVGFPNPDYANDHMYYNALWEVAQAHGVPYINYNVPDLRYGLRYTMDFADWQHLNVKGSVTFSQRLGEDLTAQFALPDRRGEAAFASYDRCAEAWYTRYPDYRPKED